MKTKTFADKLREICTYHSDGGTSGYNLSNEQFAEIEDAVKELVKEEFEDMLNHGHGGGNWRRIISMKEEALLKKLE